MPENSLGFSSGTGSLAQCTYLGPSSPVATSVSIDISWDPAPRASQRQYWWAINEREASATKGPDAECPGHVHTHNIPQCHSPSDHSWLLERQDPALPVCPPTWGGPGPPSPLLPTSPVLPLPFRENQSSPGTFPFRPNYRDNNTTFFKAGEILRCHRWLLQSNVRAKGLSFLFDRVRPKVD